MVEIIPPAPMNEQPEHTAPVLNSASAIPDNLSMDTVAAYINEKYPDLKSQLDSLGTMEKVGLSMACQKFPGLKGIVDAIQGVPNDTQEVKDASGQTFIPQDRQREEEEPEIAAEEDLSVSEQKEVIEFMADLSEQGFDLARIQNAVRREWGLDYHYLTIRRMLAAYYNRPESDDGNDTGKGISAESLRVYQKLLEKNKELQKKALEFEEVMQEKKINELVEQKVAELIPKPSQEPIPKPRKAGILRRMWRGLVGEGD